MGTRCWFGGRFSWWRWFVAYGVARRRVLDLVLGAVDVDPPVLHVHVLDGARRQQDLPTEDPRAGVDHHVARPDVIGRLVHLADVAIRGLDVAAHQIGLAGTHVGLLRIGPRFPSVHLGSLSRRSLSRRCASSPYWPTTRRWGGQTTAIRSRRDTKSDRPRWRWSPERRRGSLERLLRSRPGKPGSRWRPGAGWRHPGRTRRRPRRVA